MAAKAMWKALPRTIGCYELSKNWEKLAVQQQDAFATVTDETMFQESLNLTKWLSSLPIWKR